MGHTGQQRQEQRRPGQARPPRRLGCVCLLRLRRGLCACPDPVALRLTDLDKTKSKQLQLLPRQSVLHMHIELECIVRAGDSCFMKLQ